VDLALLAAQKAVLTQLDDDKHRRAIDDFIANLEQPQ
jgi:F0F1-type ATP synthase membrane subunit b/b'